MNEKIRVYELAKEMLVDSKVILRVLNQLNVDAKNHMSTMDEDTAQKVRDVLTGKLRLNKPKKDRVEKPDRQPIRTPIPRPPVRSEEPRQVVQRPPVPTPGKVIGKGPVARPFGRPPGQAVRQPFPAGQGYGQRMGGPARPPVQRPIVQRPATRPLVGGGVTPGQVGRPQQAGPTGTVTPAKPSAPGAPSTIPAPPAKPAAPPVQKEVPPAPAAPAVQPGIPSTPAAPRDVAPAPAGVPEPAAPAQADAPPAAPATTAGPAAGPSPASRPPAPGGAYGRGIPPGRDGRPWPAQGRPGGLQGGGPRGGPGPRPGDMRSRPGQSGPAQGRYGGYQGQQRGPSGRPQGGYGRPAGPARPVGQLGAPQRYGPGRPATGALGGAGRPQQQGKGQKRRPYERDGYGRFEKKVPQSRKGHLTSRPSQVGGSQSAPVIRGPRVVHLEGALAVKELASKMGIRVAEVIKKLMSLGVMATLNQMIDMETAAIVAADMGFEVTQKAPELSKEELLAADLDKEELEENLKPRPPVIVVMGHVDHGKTSLLDAIRKSKVTASEAGGITQHIGASVVDWKGRKVVFLDTPGHEAFTAMRARGAMVTDIAVLVVAADDGVMPQTIEALDHARAAKVPIVVAINKMDRADAKPDRVKQQLVEKGLVPEEWGGDTIFVPVSARQGTGIDQLLDMILLVADVHEFKANPDRKAIGTVIEAQLDKGKGPVATVLVQQGTLRIGDVFVIGSAWGRVRAMQDDRGRQVKKAVPSTPVEVTGLSEVPNAGDVLQVVDDERTAKDVAESRSARKRATELQGSSRLSLEDLANRVKEGEVAEFKIVVKADVQGSIEALKQTFDKLETTEVKVNIIHSGVGGITEGDVMLAAASGAIIIGFNVRPDANARHSAEEQKVDIRTYRIIYDAVNDIQAAMKGMLKPQFKEAVVGHAEVRQLFKVPKVGTVAGCYVTEGRIPRSATLRVVRDGVIVHEAPIESLKRFKDDVREVASGYECGIGIEKFQDLKEGDVLEAFVMEEVRPE